MPANRFSETHPAVKQPPFDPEKAHLQHLASTRGFTSAAWKLLETLGTLEGYTPDPHHVEIFLDSVSRCKTALERSTLLILGEGVFHFDPLEAFETVESLMLERMHALDGKEAAS